MSTDTESNSRTRVQTYVPEYQKREWQGHADDLDMSLSEFVRSMVQAGRRGFEPSDGAPADQKGGGSTSSTGKPQGSDLEEQVLSVLAAEDSADWEQLLAAVTDDVEARLDETLQSLQDEGTVRYSGRRDGYVLK